MKAILKFLSNAKTKLTTKFTVLFIIVGIVPLALSGLISYSIYQANIQQLTIDSAIQNVELKGQEIENVLSEAELFLRTGSDDRLNFFFEHESETFRITKEILSVFQLYRSSMEHEKLIRNIYIIGINGKCISERKGLYYKDPGFINSNETLSRIWENPGVARIIAEHTPDYDKDSQNTRVISMGRVFYNKVSLKPAGIIIIDMDPLEIKKLYRDYRFIDIGRIALVYDNQLPPDTDFVLWDNWIYFNQIYKQKEKYAIIRSGAKQLLFVNIPTRYPELSILGTIIVDELFAGVNIAKNYTILFFFISLSLIIIIYYIISLGLMKPLEDVQSKMHEAALGNLDVNLNDHALSMIPDLRNSFNKMTRDLKNHIEALDEEHIKYLDAELRVHQAQINPHFLYNTLDTILWSAVEQKNDEIVNLVTDMSQFFRMSLSKGAEFIRVREEIDCINSYLKIQQIRYASILSFSLEIDEEILACKMLKLLLQPLVENALYHGIKNKRAKGHIKVRGFRESGILHFIVKDDGIGMGYEKLKELSRQLRNPQDYTHTGENGVGILNVQTRIKMKYGPAYGMNVFSQPGEGTSIELTLPIRDE